MIHGNDDIAIDRRAAAGCDDPGPPADMTDMTGHVEEPEGNPGYSYKINEHNIGI